jgi:SP family arabinose:H+ symporter-like MFS transporter
MNSISKSEAAEQKKRSIYVIAIVSTAAIAGFLFGYDLGLMGAANLYLKTQFHLSDEMFGFTMASGVIGCVFGPSVGGWLCDLVGREKAIIGCAVLLGVGALMTSLAGNIWIFNIFRVVGGFGIGLGSIASPMYIAEVAPPRMRGKLGTMFQLAVVIGSAAAPLVAYAIASHFPDTLSWRLMFASQLVVVLLLILFVFMLPPSPRWLAEKDRFEDAMAVLVKVHGPELAAKELVEIRQSVSEEVGGWRELWQPGIRYALLIGLLLAFFNNCTGWTGMSSYITVLVEMSGVKSHNLAILQFALTYVAMTIMTLVSMWLIDRVGRRPLWIFASSLMILVTLATGAVFHFQIHGGLVLLVLVLCTVPHGIALGGLPWLMMSEIFPNRVRAKAVAVTTTFIWIAGFSSIQLFPLTVDLSQKLIGSAAGVFWMYTVICVFALLFGWKMMPETRGRTLEDISRSWGNRSA